jgi:4-alpha-glucanotransferase
MNDRRRRAGVLVPLFSIPSERSWGIGEIGDLPLFADWARTARLRAIQLLPINEMAHGQSSPYSALSAMAIDPIFISIGDIPSFEARGGESSLDAGQRSRLEEVRRARVVHHHDVRELKTTVLRSLFEVFLAESWTPDTADAASMRTYMDAERWWLEDYALFRAIHAGNDARHWTEWEPPLRDRDPAALTEARRRLDHEILYYTWLQWIAGTQWAHARAAVHGLELLGDFPFMVSGDSADVWARQEEFRVDASVGVPPDAFSETGQDWGLPVYLWDVHEATGYAWLRQRARRCAELFDGFRVDHLVGFYRTFVRERDGETYFVPPDEPAQKAQGERLLRLFIESSAAILAEDLGTIPDFVRESLDQLGVPGMKVLRWEREWKQEGQPFRDPATYPAISVAISGTHDTETMAEWWDNADRDERAAAAALRSLRNAGIEPDEPYSGRVRDALLSSLYSSQSDLLLMAVQDIFGWRDRINTPAVVSDDNWSWQLPWRVDRLIEQPEAAERASFLVELATRSGR